MKTILYATLTAFVVVGCTQGGPQNNPSRTASTNTAKPPENYRMMTGSHIPQPTDRPFFANLSANAPANSSAREGISIVPTEPTVGAGQQSAYRQNEPSTGAGPEGEPTVQGATGSTTTGPITNPHPRPARKLKPKATPAPTPN